MERLGSNPYAMKHTPGSQAWLDQVQEEIIDPARPIIDPHHHLWDDAHRGSYLLSQLWRDTGSGHRVEKTVFIECRAKWRRDGAEAMKPVGEAEWVARIARASREGGGGAVIAGFVGHADLRLGARLEAVLAAHQEASQGLFRGIRHAGAREPHPQGMSLPGAAPEGLYADPDFRQGMRKLGELGLSFDTWHFHHQNPSFAALARAVPDTQMVLDHFGTPLGVGVYAAQRELIFAQWQKDIEEIAQCPNVVAKLGGLAMPDNGFGWHQRDYPASSDELVASQARYYHHTIECFGPSRCMFESNFPVDRRSVSYAVYWNAAKKIAAKYSQLEQHAMLYGTAEKTYKLL